MAALDRGGGPAKPQPRLRLTNTRGTTRLERLRISRWNGQPPPQVAADAARIHRIDGTLVVGQVAGFDPASREFIVRGSDGGPARVPAAQVDSLYLSPPREAAGPGVTAVTLDDCRWSGE